MVTEIASDSTAIRKGVLWQQRDKVFSRWKERFFLLTQDYLQAFKKSTNQMSEMGRFLFKLKLSEVTRTSVKGNIGVNKSIVEKEWLGVL